MSDYLTELMQEVGKLEYEFEQLRRHMTPDEWFEILRRDLEDQQLRRQNELQAYIRHARHIIAERKT